MACNLPINVYVIVNVNPSQALGDDAETGAEGLRS